MSDDPTDKAIEAIMNPKQVRGWPKGKKRGPRKPVREEVRSEVRAEQKVLKGDWAGEYPDLEDDDRLRIPRSEFPDGMDYQWVTSSVFGQPQPQRRARFERNGWRPVPSKRHPQFMGAKYPGESEIEVDGLVLMERPLEWSIRAKRKNTAKANEQVAIREQSLRSGNIEGVSLDTQHNTALKSNKISKSYERIPIPED